jgi:hypothetical protein
MELLGGFLTLGGGIFSLIVVVFGTWMSWRILEKAGFPGWVVLIVMAINFIPGIGFLIGLVLIWMFAFMNWPRDTGGAVATVRATAGPAPGPTPSGGWGPPPAAERLPPPGAAPMLPMVRPGWKLEGSLADGTAFSLVVDEAVSQTVVAGAVTHGDVVLADPSVSSPHARLHTAPGRLGLEDLNSTNGTWIDGARLLPVHGVREVTGSKLLRFGAVEARLTRVGG